MAYNYEWPYTDPNRYNDDWLLKTVKEVYETVKNLEDWQAQHISEYEELKKLYDDIMKGNFPDSIKTAFYNWMSNNAIDLVGSLVKSVFFGLTDSGYFIAYIPESWKDIIFNTTGLDIETALMPEYGHLILSY